MVVELFNIYSGFLKILKILDFIAKTMYFFPKKYFFELLEVKKKTKFQKSEKAIS